MRRDAGWRSRRNRTRLRRRHVGHGDELHVEDKVGLGGDAGTAGMVGNGMHSIGQLPGNEDAAFTTDPHAGKSVVEAGNDGADALGKRRGLGFQLGFAVGAEFRLAVLAHDGLRVFVPRIELDAVGCAPAGVLEVPDLSGCALGAGANLDFFVVHHDRTRPDGTVRDHGHAGRQLDPRRRRTRGCGGFCGGGRAGRRRELRCRRCGGRWLRGSLGARGEGCCSEDESKNDSIHVWTNSWMDSKKECIKREGPTWRRAARYAARGAR